MRSWTEFSGPVREALHRLKYKKDIGLGEALSQPILDWFVRLNWPIDIIVPVPLSPGRLRERGYNQVEYLARPLALGLGKAYKPKALSRIRETASQVGLNRLDRRNNVSGAFYSNSLIVHGKVVLVVDDVATTGATLDSCAKALLNAGAIHVYAITAARAVHF
jgi:ComF family protein